MKIRHTLRGVAQFGRALGLGPRGRRFKSGRPDFLQVAICCAAMV